MFVVNDEYEAENLLVYIEQNIIEQNVLDDSAGNNKI